MDPEIFASAMEEAYGPTGVRCNLIQSSMREVYRVTADSAQYVLYLYSPGAHTAAEICGEWEWVNHLYQRGASVAPSVPQPNGDLLLTLQIAGADRHAVLGRYIEGEHLRRRYSAEAVHRYGHAIAEIHRLADNLPLSRHRPPLDFDSIVGCSLRALGGITLPAGSDMVYFEAASAVLQTHFQALPRRPHEYGMIHGDVIRANAQISTDGTVTVLDFDLCGPGWRAYDVASFLQVAHTEEARQSFIEGYTAVRPLTEDEVEWLPLFEAARHLFSLGVPAMHYDTWGREALTRSFIDEATTGLRNCIARL